MTTESDKQSKTKRIVPPGIERDAIEKALDAYDAHHAAIKELSLAAALAHRVAWNKIMAMFPEVASGGYSYTRLTGEVYLTDSKPGSAK